MVEQLGQVEACWKVVPHHQSHETQNKYLYNARSNANKDSGERDEIFQLLTQLKEDYPGEDYPGGLSWRLCSRS